MPCQQGSIAPRATTVTACASCTPFLLAATPVGAVQAACCWGAHHAPVSLTAPDRPDGVARALPRHLPALWVLCTPREVKTYASRQGFLFVLCSQEVAEHTRHDKALAPLR